MASRRIYIPQVDRIFDSVAAAASALGVNSSNLRKTITGQRKSAGGYTAMDASSYTRGGKTITPNRRSLRNKAAAAGVLTPPKDPLYSKRMELKELLEITNANAKEIKKSGLEHFAVYSNKALSFIDDIGGKRGFYDTSYANLANLSEAELDKYITAISNFKKHDTFSLKGAARAGTTRSNAMGITLDLMKEYKSIMPMIFRIFDSIYDKDYKYEQIVTDVADAMDEGASPDEILEILSKIDNTEAQKQILSTFISDNPQGFNYHTLKALTNYMNVLQQDPNNVTLQQATTVITQLLSMDSVDEATMRAFLKYVSGNYNDSAVEDDILYFRTQAAHNINDTAVSDLAEQIKNHLIDIGVM